MWGWFVRVMIGLDQFLNAILGGLPSETISYRSAKLRDKGSKFACYLCLFLDIFEKNHCDNTVLRNDKERLIIGA